MWTEGENRLDQAPPKPPVQRKKSNSFNTAKRGVSGLREGGGGGGGGVSRAT